MTIEILGTGQPDGTGVVKSAAEKINLYGETPKAQAAHIGDAVAATGITGTDVASITGSAATNACSNADHAALKTILNSILGQLSDIGVHASS